MIKYGWMFCLMANSVMIIAGPLDNLFMRGLKIHSSGAPQMLARLYSRKADSIFAGKDLQAVLDEEHALILKILTLKEIAYSVPEYGSPSFREQTPCIVKGYAKREHELYQELARLRLYKSSLESKGIKND